MNPFFAGACLLAACAPYVEVQERDVRPVQSEETGALTGKLGARPVELGVYGALLIAIEEYPLPYGRLKTPREDVERLRDVLTTRYGFPSKNVRLLLDGDATRAGILDALAEYRDGKMGAIDNLLIYYAGHGHRDPGSGDGFWIPYDATSAQSSWVPTDDVLRIVRNVRGLHTLLVSDSCFSGTLTRRIVEGDRYLSEVIEKRSSQIITSGGLEPVADQGRDGLSLFAYALATYLESQPRVYVTAGRLFADLAPQVSNASGSLQTPEYGRLPGAFDDQGELVLVRLDGAASLFPEESEIAPAPRVVTSAEQEEWAEVLEEFLIPFDAILKHNYQVFQELTDDKKLRHLEGHPIALQNYIQSLPDSDLRKIDWKFRIERLLTENRRAVGLIQRWRGKMIGDDFQRSCAEFEFHANKWEDFWNAVVKGGAVPPELSQYSTLDRRYAPGFPQALEPALKAEIEEVRRRAGR